MDILSICIFLPHCQIRFHVNPLNPVQGDHIEFPYRLVILRRIAGSCYNPSLRYLMASKGLALEKLQHSRSQGFGYAVDFIYKENSFLKSCFLHPVIDGGHNLAHGILRHRILPVPIHFFLDEGKAHRALSGVMGDGIGYQPDPAFPGYLLHYLGLSHSGGTDKQHRPLPDGWYDILPILIL